MRILQNRKIKRQKERQKVKKKYENFTVEIYLSLIYENFCQIMNFIYKELEKNKLIINIRQLIKLYDNEKKEFFQIFSMLMEIDHL